MKYRKKPIEIEAVQWNRPGDHPEVIQAWKDADTGAVHGPSIDAKNPAKSIVYAIRTMEGWHEVTPGDFIIRGVHGELYPCKPDIFEATYEAVE